MTSEANEQLSKQIQDDFLSLDIPNMTIWEIYAAGFTKGGKWGFRLLKVI